MLSTSLILCRPSLVKKASKLVAEYLKDAVERANGVLPSIWPYLTQAYARFNPVANDLGHSQTTSR